MEHLIESIRSRRGVRTEKGQRAALELQEKLYEHIEDIPTPLWYFGGVSFA